MFLFFRSTIEGSILRLDVSLPATNVTAYAIPPDNPFVNNSDCRPEIYAHGFRNPWTAKMDQGPGLY